MEQQGFSDKLCGAGQAGRGHRGREGEAVAEALDSVTLKA